MREKNPLTELGYVYNPKIDALFPFYLIAKSVAAAEEAKSGYHFPFLSTSDKSVLPVFIPAESRVQSEILASLAPNFASEKGPDTPEISEADIRATIIIDEDIFKRSKWDNKKIPAIFKEISQVEYNFLENLKKIKMELDIIRQQSFLSEEEKAIISTALNILETYITSQKDYCEIISALKLPNPLEDKEEHRQQALQIFFRIHQNDVLKKQQGLSEPFMEHFEKIDAILQAKQNDCEKIKEQLPIIASTYSYLLKVRVAQNIQRRPMPCTEWIEYSGVAKCSSADEDAIKACIVIAKFAATRIDLLSDIEKRGYVRPPGLAQFIEGLGFNIDYSVTNILLGKKGEELSNIFIAFAQTQKIQIRDQIDFFKTVYRLLKSEPLTCADLKPLSFYCSHENPLDLPEDILLTLQLAFREKENSSITVRKVVDALIPTMQYIYADLQRQLHKFQFSNEICSVLANLPEIKVKLNTAGDLFSLTKKDIEGLPQFLRDIFIHPDSALVRSFAEKIKLLVEDENYFQTLSPIFSMFSVTEEKIVRQYSEKELEGLISDIRQELKGLSVSDVDEVEEQIDAVLRRIIELRFHRKIKDLYALEAPSSPENSVEKKSHVRPVTRSEISLAHEATKDEVLTSILLDKNRICGCILSEFKRIRDYEELVRKFNSEQEFSLLLRQSITEFIDVEVRKEIKLAANPPRIEGVRVRFSREIGKKSSQKKAVKLFKSMFMNELIEEEFYLVLKALLSEKVIPESYNSWIMQKEKKKEILKKIKKALKATEWYGSLDNFFKIGKDNQNFFEPINTISDIIENRAFVSKIGDGLQFIRVEIEQSIKQEEENFFISIRNYTVRALIEKEFDRQIRLLKEADIFLDTLVQQLEKNKNNILKQHIKKIYAHKDTIAFMESYRFLLLYMPYHILDALPKSFSKKKFLNLEAVFSKTFLALFEGTFENSNKVSLKEIIELYSLQYRTAANEQVLSIRIYSDLKQRLQQSFLSKKEKRSISITETPPPSKKLDGRGVPPPNTPNSPLSISTPVTPKIRLPSRKPAAKLNGIFSFPRSETTTIINHSRGESLKPFVEKLSEKIAIQTNTHYRLESYTQFSSTDIRPCSASSACNLLKVYDKRELVFTAQVEKHKSVETPSLSLPVRDICINSYRHKPEDASLMIETMAESISSKHKMTLEINSNSSPENIARLISTYVGSALKQGVNLEVILNGSVLEPRKVYRHLETVDKSLADHYQMRFLPSEKRGVLQSASSIFGQSCRQKTRLIRHLPDSTPIMKV